ncbi:hypothetical protein [Treponema sp.]|uniref:hypothetical protein n=1 Tax=Treponema sp. TaxID=166 RepID=UPI00298DF8BF|nr:hypothetical protein [Treponema sp.]MCR5614424.1 hypothetical protein [Treponema sp.]
MQKIKQIFRSAFLVLCSVYTFPLFAEVTILSPASNLSRTWANKQMLLINTTEDEEVFYSFSGTDPLTSGFAYDGPVLLDVTGDVELKVASIDRNKKRTDYVLNYTVDETQKSNLTAIDEIEFINLLEKNPVYDLSCGKEFIIPQGLEYSISSNDKSYGFESGRSVAVMKESSLERYVSLTLRSKTNDYWNFIIHVVPIESGELSKEPVPFEFLQWSKIFLADNAFIYSIDGEWWQGYGKTIELDRSVSHVIKWQNVDYNPENPIHSYIIPATPVVRAEKQADSSIVLTLEGDDSYRFAKSRFSQNVFLPDGLYKTILVDAFQGENLLELMPVDIYSNNVYNGTLYASFQVNRKRPQAPEIIMNDNSLIKRKDVTLGFKTQNDDNEKVLYYIDGPLSPVLLNNASDAPVEIQVSPDSFEEYEGKSILLTASEDKPVLYRVFCYTVDKWDNTSPVICTDININKCDYYVDGNAKFKDADGSYQRPFSDLSQIEKIVNENNYTRFYIKGRVAFPDEKIKLRRNVSFVGEKSGSEIIFSKNSGIYVIQASLFIDKLILKNVAPDSNSVSGFINLENSVLNLENSEITFSRHKNATAINCSGSVLTVAKSGISAVSNDYACAVSANDSKVTLTESRLSTVGSTNVIISCRKTKLQLLKNSCTVTGLNGRIAELYFSYSIAIDNTFEAKDIQHRIKNIPIWNDELSYSEEYHNTVTGF